MVVLFALIGVLMLGLIIGLLWRGVLLVGDRQVLDQLSAEMLAEQRMQAYTRVTLERMRRVASERPETWHQP